MNYKDMIELAKHELLDGAGLIDVIELLQQQHDLSPFEAEELVEIASEELVTWEEK